MCSGKMSSDELGEEIDAFKLSFKQYKNKSVSPDLSEVLKFDDCQSSKGISKLNLNSTLIDNLTAKKLGLKSVEEWQIFTIRKHNGLFYIVNPFTPTGQKYWINRSLFDYPNPPNVTNLSNVKKQEKIHSNKQPADKWKYLRWSTLGYHHNWDTKVYDLNCHTQFPVDLASLTQFFATVLGYNTYSAEAAIVNYYHLNSTLAGHVDKSEFDLKAPLFSISFGQPAIFLLGGQTKSVIPSAMLVNSGDVIVMSDDCRLSYHAVPRILQSDLTPWLEDDEHINTAWQNVNDYLRKSRINLNVRQVFTHS